MTDRRINNRRGECLNCEYRGINGYEVTMLGKLRTIFLDRRVADRREQCQRCDRRNPTRQEATERLDNAIHSFSETITLSPEKVKKLLEKAHLK